MKTTKILATTLATLLLAGCAEEVASPATEHSELTFAVSIADGGGDVSISRSVAYDEAEQNVLMQGKGSQQLYVHTMVEPRTTVKGTTRATLLYGETFPVDRTFGVSGYRYSQATQLSTTMPNFYYNAAVNYSGAKWVSNKAYYIPANDEQLAFYAYWPYDASAATLSSSTASGPMTISYTVNTTDITAQEDLMTACVTGLSYRSSPDYRVPLVFRHALAAIRIELGEDVAPGYVRKVSLLNVCLSGTHTIGGGWTPTNKGNLEVDFTNGDTTNGYDTNSQMGVATILDGEKTLLMIPQVFAADDENACLYFEINDGTLTHGLYYHLNGQSWEAGTVTTYRIDTHSINTARLAEVEYPADWGGETFSLKNTYAANDTVGLYAVDGNEVKAANVAYAYNGTSWQPISSTALPYSKDYTYYAYYPYRKNVAGGHAVGDKVTADDTADNFFGSLVSSWAVSTDQSTAEKLLANDLQLGKGTKSTTQRSTITLGMQHKMGLAGISLEEKNVTGTVRFYQVGDLYDTGTYTTATNQSVYIYATSEIQQYTPFFTGSATMHLFIVRGGENYIFESVAGEYNSWDSALTVNVEYGNTNKNYIARLKSGIATTGYTFKGKEFNCINDVATYIPPKRGSYKLEVYGAQGGNATSGGRTAVGGYGGYAVGNYFMGNIENLYICVGGKGGNTVSTIGAVGYNGGNGGSMWSNVRWGASGGTTHIAKSQNLGTLKNYVNNKNNVLIVAGAGGGAGCDGSNVNAGGSGGGVNGSNGRGALPGTGGSQTGGGYGRPDPNSSLRFGSFGYGGPLSAGGGAGWYGGGGANYNASSGGGGSGYIGGVMNGTMSTGVRSGDGYARITTPVIV